jgi:hypothetical protein
MKRQHVNRMDGFDVHGMKSILIVHYLDRDSGSGGYRAIGTHS